MFALAWYLIVRTVTFADMRFAGARMMIAPIHVCVCTDIRAHEIPDSIFLSSFYSYNLSFLELADRCRIGRFIVLTVPPQAKTLNYFTLFCLYSLLFELFFRDARCCQVPDVSLSAPDMPSADVDVSVSAPDMPAGDVDTSVSAPDVPSVDVKSPKKKLFGKFLKKKPSKASVEASYHRLRLYQVDLCGTLLGYM